MINAIFPLENDLGYDLGLCFSIILYFAFESLRIHFFEVSAIEVPNHQFIDLYIDNMLQVRMYVSSLPTHIDGCSMTSPF